MEESPKEDSICVNKDKALKMINYSIIIPHKNSPDLLQYCLDSIPVRDDVQVIVVDDNSDADKVDFEHFPRWKGEHYEYYLTKEGRGAGYARNVGLEHSQGKWVLFADADDYFLPEINEGLDECVDEQADIVFFRPVGRMLRDRNMPSKRGNVINRRIDEYYNTCNEVGLRCWTYSPWGKFLKLSFLNGNNIRFEEIRYSNDVWFSALSGIKAKTIRVLDKPYYCLTESDNTLTSNNNNKPGELKIRADVFFRTQELVHDNGYPIYEFGVLYYLRKLYSEDKGAFVLDFNRVRKMGYKKTWLLHNLFKENNMISRVKRIVYAFVKTGF